MPHGRLTDASLNHFLAAFYADVRGDALLAPIFASRIAEADWPQHLATIHDFWSSVLLKTGRYKGNPFARHVGIPYLGAEHFDRWLSLFAQTAQATFIPEIAGLLIDRAHRIGESLQAGLALRGPSPMP